MLDFKRYEMDYIKSNMYILLNGKEALIIDPNVSEEGFQLLKEKGIQRATILLTHEHFDHTVGINRIRDMMEAEVICQKECAKSIAVARRNRPLSLLMIKGQDSPKQIREFYNSFSLYTCYADRSFEFCYEFDWRSHSVFMIATPGHSKGSCCIEVDSKYVFTGDSLIQDIPVITRYPGGSMEEYERQTVPYLEKLSEEAFIIPGHGVPCNMGKLKYKERGVWDVALGQTSRQPLKQIAVSSCSG